jgi:hypothetical protein
MSAKASSKPDKEPAALSAYVPTTEEEAALAVYLARRTARPKPQDLNVVNKDGSTQLSPKHPDLKVGYTLMANAVGAGSMEFLHSLLESLAQATANKGLPDELGLNNALGFVQALQPRDELEAMLAAQMALVHAAVGHAARRVQHSDTLQQMEANDRCLNRLARTFVAQTEALKRYRTGGQQRMTVEHVHVHEGGQAIVGTINRTGGFAGETFKPEPTA